AAGAGGLPARLLRPSPQGRALRTRGVLVVVEVALAVTLVASAGLLLRSFWSLSRVEPGFDGERVLTMEVALPGARYEDGAKVARFYRELLARLGMLPGVESAAASSGPPMGNSRSNWDVEVEGQVLAPGQAKPSPFYHSVTPDYFRALGIRVVRGRGFTPEEDTSRLETAVVNESAARMLWPGEDPLGRRFRLSGGPADNPFPWVTVVGVAADVLSTRLSEGSRPEYYLLHGPLAEARDITHRSMTVVLRTRMEPHSLAQEAKRTVRELDGMLAVANVQTLEEAALKSVSRTRFIALLLALFGGAGLTLAAVGIYGVLAFAVARRTREMGIRMALGARRVDVLGLVVKQGLRLTAVGVVLGTLGALAAGRLLHGLLYGVSAADPLTFLSVVAVLGAVALLASYLPARRATSVDPVTALRSE
ncbi:FtsX-like permease family protein, partial [Pyxidicoccus sp. 3LG]